MSKAARAIAVSVLFLSGCSTLNESFELGGATGAVVGGIASYTAKRSSGVEPSLKEVASSAGIGMAAGLLLSYFVHKQVEEDRNKNNPSGPEMHFGDLPPNPFMNQGQRKWER